MECILNTGCTEFLLRVTRGFVKGAGQARSPEEAAKLTASSLGLVRCPVPALRVFDMFVYRCEGVECVYLIHPIDLPSHTQPVPTQPHSPDPTT